MRRIGTAAVGLLWCVMMTWAQPASRPALYTGPILPSPPQQKSAWTSPPTTLPAELVSVTEELFAQGLADPRCGEYREIGVVCGSVWGAAGIVTTNGWVLPAVPAAKDRYAVCWNGLVYPVTRIGDPKDAADDVKAILKATAEFRSKLSPEQRKFRVDSRLGALPESEAVSFKSATLVKLPLMLRAGHSALAGEFLAQLYGPDADAKSLSLAIASEWAWCHFDRAVCAHIRGDDVIAVSSTRLLSAAVPAIEKYLAGRGVKNPYMNSETKDAPYLLALEPLPALAADCERRVAREPLPTLAAVEQIKDASARIAALIQQLETIDERQWGQPGGVSVANSPVIRAIEKEGDAAVDPLLACIEKDDRLTRSVSFGRDFHTHRNLITVADAATVAVKQILQFSEFGYGKPAEQLLGIKALWEKTRGNSPPQRWFAILADDNATARQWVEAAGRIVQPADVESRGGWVTVPHRKPGEVPAMRGESLREMKNPTVSELLIRRIPQIADAENGHQFSIDRANTVAGYLTRWDPSSATVTLRDQLERTKTQLRKSPNSSANDPLKIEVGRLTIALAKAGDATAVKDYTAWLREQHPDQAPSSTDKLFAPFWQFPDDPAVIETTKGMFLDRNSPWFNLSRTKTSFGGTEKLLTSPLVSMPAFREHIVVNFTDTSRVGVATKNGDQLHYKIDNGASGGQGLTNKDDPLSPPPGQERVIRVCDWYAWKLSRLPGTPAFELYWPDVDRDAAIKTYEAFLAKWGPAYGWNPMQATLYERMSDPATITIPERNRPATQQEVDAATAIFSLPGEARALKLSRFPAVATWKKERGRVWQAEEVQEGGQWKTYFGFIGPHTIAKVPAEDVVLQGVTVGR